MAKMEILYADKSREANNYEQLMERKDKIIKELETLIFVYESQLHENRTKRGSNDEVEEEIGETSSKEEITERYSNR
jgi:hypothetical protein